MQILTRCNVFDILGKKASATHVSSLCNFERWVKCAPADPITAIIHLYITHLVALCQITHPRVFTKYQASFRTAVGSLFAWNVSCGYLLSEPSDSRLLSLRWDLGFVTD